MFSPLNFAYIETHFKLMGCKARFYQKEPELVFDAPVRCIYSRSHSIPIALIVKDAHLFPIKILNITIHLNFNDQKSTIPLNFIKNFNQPLTYEIFNIPIQDAWIDNKIEFFIEFSYEKDSKIKTTINDNFIGLKKLNFSCYINAQKSVFPDNYWLGDPHYHSSYTSDQVEFGAPLEITKLFAYTMGLDWFFATDHSYDLDDYKDDYLRNDPKLEKWQEYLKEISALSESKLKIIAGEEVSIGNSKNQNVHLLLIDNPEFIPGKGDSGEAWLSNKCTLNLSDLHHIKDKNALLIAAHPFEEVPLLQKLLLNRGKWLEKDYLDNDLIFLQGINQAELLNVYHAVNCWTKLLLKGKRYYLLAGNDAHGNFQYMKQIKIAFLKLFISKKQIFGQFFSALKYPENSPIEAIKTKHILISNGPFLDFVLINQEEFTIGNVFKKEKAQINYIFNSNLEFGELKTLKLFIGNIDKKQEICIINPNQGIELTLPKKGYARMECITEKKAVAFTNAIWIDRC